MLSDWEGGIAPLDAVVLVGLIHTHRILISRELRDLAARALRWEPIWVEPLALRAAAELVALRFKLDWSRLFCDFEHHWAGLRETARLAALAEQFAAHRCVEKLVPFPRSYL